MNQVLVFGILAHECLIGAHVARANDLALNEGAYGIEPLDVRRGSESPVRLVEEELIIHFGREESSVAVRFLFHNTWADSAVHQLSGFPDIAVGLADSVGSAHWSFHPIPNTMQPLRNMRTYVNGKRVKSTLRYGFVAVDSSAGYFVWVPSDRSSGRRVAWHVVPLDLAPDGFLHLERRYQTTNGMDGLVGRNFFYITQTGGPWQGKIGKLTAHVVLEDGLTTDDLCWESPTKEMQFLLLMQPPKAEWTLLGPTELRLVWSDFEPMSDPGRDAIVLVWRTREFLEPVRSQ